MASRPFFFLFFSEKMRQTIKQQSHKDTNQFAKRLTQCLGFWRFNEWSHVQTPDTTLWCWFLALQWMSPCSNAWNNTLMLVSGVTMNDPMFIRLRQHLDAGFWRYNEGSRVQTPDTTLWCWFLALQWMIPFWLWSVVLSAFLSDSGEKIRDRETGKLG